LSVLGNRVRFLLSPQFDAYEHIAKLVHGDVADIGFGTGFGMHLYAEGANKVDGYEIDKECIDFARRAFPSDVLKFHYGNILEGLKENYDVITMVDVIEHIPQDSLAIQNAYSALRDDGCLIVTTPNRLSRYRKSDNHIREYSPDGIMDLLNKQFTKVTLCDIELQPLTSKYYNPIIAICHKN